MTTCSGLAYPGPKVDTRGLLDDLGRLGLAGDRTKVVGA